MGEVGRRTKVDLNRCQIDEVIDVSANEGKKKEGVPLDFFEEPRRVIERTNFAGG